MKASWRVAALFCFVAACGSGSPTITLEKGEGLKGTVIRDHPNGAEVVEVPPGSATGFASGYPHAIPTAPILQQGAVVREINGTRVRNAAHARELINAVAEKAERGEFGSQEMFEIKSTVGN